MALAPIPQRNNPRLSAAQLADYLVASQVVQLTILRQAKYPQSGKPLIIQYQHARRAISACLVAPSQAARIIGAAIADLEQRRDDSSSPPLVKEDAQRSIEVLNLFSRSVNARGIQEFHFDTPQKGGCLLISGVEVSVSPDAISLSQHRRDGARVGQAFIRCAVGGTSENAENKRSEANIHLATIAHMHAVETLEGRGIPHCPTSIVLDVPRSRLVTGPTGTAMRVRNIEAACSIIAAVWPTL
jgi:hypothetical protein